MYICDIEFVGCAIFPSSRIARKGTMPSLKVMEHNPVRLLNYFQVKSFGFGPILQIDRPIVSFLIFHKNRILLHLALAPLPTSLL